MTKFTDSLKKRPSDKDAKRRSNSAGEESRANSLWSKITQRKINRISNVGDLEKGQTVHTTYFKSKGT